VSCAVGVDRNNVGDHTGVEPDAEPRRDLLAFGRVVQQYRASAGGTGGRREIGCLRRDKVVIQVLGGGPENGADAVFGERGRNILMQVAVQGNGGLPEGTGPG